MDDLRATWYTSSCLSRGIFLPLLVFGFYFCPWLGCDDGAFARFSLVDIVLISEVRIFEKTRTKKDTVFISSSSMYTYDMIQYLFTTKRYGWAMADSVGIDYTAVVTINQYAELQQYTGRAKRVTPSVEKNKKKSIIIHATCDDDVTFFMLVFPQPSHQQQSTR